jgi:hypothetical protein
MLNLGERFIKVASSVDNAAIGYMSRVVSTFHYGVVDENGLYHNYKDIEKIQSSPQCQIKELENQIERLKQSLIEVGKTYGVATVLGTHGDYVWIKNQGAVPITLSRQNFFDRYLKDKHCD